MATLTVRVRDDKDATWTYVHHVETAFDVVEAIANHTRSTGTADTIFSVDISVDPEEA